MSVNVDNSKQVLSPLLFLNSMKTKFFLAQVVARPKNFLEQVLLLEDLPLISKPLEMCTEVVHALGADMILDSVRTCLHIEIRSEKGARCRYLEDVIAESILVRHGVRWN